MKKVLGGLRKDKMEEEIKNEFEKIWKKIQDIEEKMSLNKPSEITKEKVYDIFDIEGEKLILTKIIGEKTMDKTQNISLLVLLGHKQKLGQEKVPSSAIKENVAMHEVPLENFGTHLKKLIPQSILKIGKVGSTKVVYKLTPFGEARAKRLLKEIFENE